MQFHFDRFLHQEKPRNASVQTICVIFIEASFQSENLGISSLLFSCFPGDARRLTDNLQDTIFFMRRDSSCKLSNFVKGQKAHTDLTLMNLTMLSTLSFIETSLYSETFLRLQTYFLFMFEDGL